MKRSLVTCITLSGLMLFSVTASAHEWPNDNDGNWYRVHNRHEADNKLPFAWNDSYKHMRQIHHLKPIHDRSWENRFPGLRAYRGRIAEGFWHNGHYVKEAVFFFNARNELVSVGYVSDGVFVQMREDHKSFENKDKFFAMWWLAYMMANS
ncbi:MAG: hypothetical protein H6Q67_1075 [Firmicutes bacterium]|nr:hypothetical protein [Bacillota bacterium]